MTTNQDTCSNCVSSRPNVLNLFFLYFCLVHTLPLNHLACVYGPVHTLGATIRYDKVYFHKALWPIRLLISPIFPTKIFISKQNSSPQYSNGGPFYIYSGVGTGGCPPPPPLESGGRVVCPPPPTFQSRVVLYITSRASGRAILQLFCHKSKHF